MISPDVVAVLQSDVIVLYRLPRLDESEPSLSRLCQLTLPPLRSKLQYKYNYFSNDSHQRPSSTPRTPASYQRLPFSNDLTQGIIHLLLLVATDTETSQAVHSYSLALSRKALSTIAEAEAEPTANLSTRVDAVSWNEWGPRSSRMFPDEHPFLVPFKHAGQRWISRDTSSRMIVMRDFNSFRARRLHSEITEGSAHVNDNGDAEYGRRTIKVRVGPSTSIQSNEYFAEDIVSELPCCETEFGPYPADVLGFMTDGEQLIGFMHRVVSSVLYYEMAFTDTGIYDRRGDLVLFVCILWKDASERSYIMSLALEGYPKASQKKRKA
jgi:hypothetical protein